VTDASELLRSELLRETSILVVAASSSPIGETPAESFGHAVREACERLGSRVHMYGRDGDVDETAMDAAVTSVVAAVAGTADASADIADPGGIDMLVVDGAALFASGGLRACLDSAWDATRAVVNLAFLPAARGGRIVYLAPAPGAGEQADAARAGLENLARTLSVEWARHQVTLVTIALGDDTAPGEAAALAAYLASPAGAYFSGCLLDLRGV
jgi:NAD(P)-dependent dehydrogenase (short-subunit alcohol dehydrogenase family)